MNGIDRPMPDPGKPIEEWRWVPGYEGLYMVSSLGNVMSQRSGKGSSPMSILKPSIGNSGYLQVVLRGNGKSKNVMIHRMVAVAFIPNYDHKEQVNHIDGDKTNNCVQNLEWVSRSENMLHAYRELGFDVSGRRKTAKKLTREQILDIYHSSETGRALASKYNISDTMVYAIKNGKSWSDITCPSTA